MATKDVIEEEIKQLSAELCTLRLPHKLNRQYRITEKRLRSLEGEITTAGLNADLSDRIRRLQSELESSVLCGVTQCFLCSGAGVQTGGPLPLNYNRSLSAKTTGTLTGSELSTSKYSNDTVSLKSTSKKPPPATESSNHVFSYQLKGLSPEVCNR